MEGKNNASVELTNNLIKITGQIYDSNEKRGIRTLASHSIPIMAIPKRRVIVITPITLISFISSIRRALLA